MLSCVDQNNTVNRYLRGMGPKNSKLRVACWFCLLGAERAGRGARLPPRFSGPGECPGMERRTLVEWRGSVGIKPGDGFGVDTHSLEPSPTHLRLRSPCFELSRIGHSRARLGGRGYMTMGGGIMMGTMPPP